MMVSTHSIESTITSLNSHPLITNKRLRTGGKSKMTLATGATSCGESLFPALVGPRIIDGSGRTIGSGYEYNRKNKLRLHFFTMEHQ